MSIRVTCEKCGAGYDVPETRAGQVGRCKCGNGIRVPVPEPKPELPAHQEPNTIHIVCDKCGAEYNVPIKDYGPQPKEWANTDNIRAHKCACGEVIYFVQKAGLGQTAAAPKTGFREARTTSVDEALRVLFEEALPSAEMQNPEHIEMDYLVVQQAWDSAQLHEGTPATIRALVSRNLRRVGNEPGFTDFTLSVVTGHAQGVQVIAAFLADGRFVPVRVWRTPEKYYACGNSLFAP